jgi:hypothetical protein
MSAMDRAITVEVTFVGPRARDQGATTVTPDGVLRLPDDTLRPFSGWMDLLAALEPVASSVLAEQTDHPDEGAGR